MSATNSHLQFFVASGLQPSDANPHMKLHKGARQNTLLPDPPPPDTTGPVEDDHPSDTPSTQKALHELRAMLSQQATPLTEDQCRFCTDSLLSRYLNAYPRSVERAHSALQATLKWRGGRDFDTLQPARICRWCAEADEDKHCFFSVGQDVKRGWEVFYSCPSRGVLKDPESAAHHTFIELERAFERSPKFLMLVDLHGLGMRDLDPRTAVYIVRGLMAHYPERIGQVAILDAPWVFSVTWEMLKTIVDEKAAAKALMLRGDAMNAYFEEWLTPEQAMFMRDVLQLPGKPGSFPRSLGALATSRLARGVPGAVQHHQHHDHA
eukprot:CAMPEP_0115865858 /NCGR_PEP_ID=MMETSP0287-20121206/19939_1 /TAXON_ID=412157 /ORGANISM="Chrysochromulina rotalis, Strain UIO044" /LENGTH=321 /DNA_ID=CAMNT_0003320385 /DNA_START=13 /DNA_END=978 /DNA_ORIENTATION=-